MSDHDSVNFSSYASDPPDDRPSNSPEYGKDRATQYDATCGPNSYVTGIRTYSSHLVNQIQLGCKNGQIKGPFGGQTNTYNEMDCPEGFRKFGIRFPGTTIDRLILQCEGTQKTIGGTGGEPSEFECPYDQVLEGISGGASGDRIESIRFFCSATGKCSDPQTILAGQCPYYCASPFYSSNCLDTVANYCLSRMATDANCRKYIMLKENQGKYKSNDVRILSDD